MVTGYGQASGLFCSGNYIQTNFTSDCFVTKGREESIPEYWQEWNGFCPHDYYGNRHATV
jgi:hypothetical protein